MSNIERRIMNVEGDGLLLFIIRYSVFDIRYWLVDKG